MNKTLNKMSEIQNLEYVGYYWLSNSNEPVLIQSAQELEKYETSEGPTNPFILEAYLYNQEKQVSVTIRHTDGRYLINEFKLSGLDEENKVKKEYLANQALNSEKVKFTEIWLTEKDANCNNFEVLTKKAVLFTGFQEV